MAERFRIAASKYNGLAWCIVKTSDTDADGNLDQRRFRYYNAEWQLVEERIDDESAFLATIKVLRLHPAADAES